MSNGTHTTVDKPHEFICVLIHEAPDETGTEPNNIVLSRKRLKPKCNVTCTCCS